LSEKNIKLILLFIPVAAPLNAIDPDKQEKVIEIFENAAIADKGVYFLDYNQDHQHDLKLFYDLRHLNAKGNMLVTDRLAGDVQNILSGASSPGY
jgi:lysophospholipase L1-like esterase